MFSEVRKGNREILCEFVLARRYPNYQSIIGRRYSIKFAVVRTKLGTKIAEIKMIQDA